MSRTRQAADLWFPAAVRASVERGDPAAVFIARERMFSGDYVAFADGSTYTPPLTAYAHPPEPDPPQPVTADPETLDPEPDRNYPDGVAHHVDSDGRLSVAEGEHGASQHSSPPPFDRAAWLARVQRIDPRERRP